MREKSWKDWALYFRESRDYYQQAYYDASDRTVRYITGYTLALIVCIIFAAIGWAA